MDDKQKKWSILAFCFFIAAIVGAVTMNGGGQNVAKQNQTVATVQENKAQVEDKQKQKEEEEEAKKKEEERLKAEQEAKKQQEKEQRKQAAKETVNAIIGSLTPEYDQVEHVTWYMKTPGNRYKEHDYATYYVGKRDGDNTYFIRFFVYHTRRWLPGGGSMMIGDVTFSSSAGVFKIRDGDKFPGPGAGDRRFNVKSQMLAIDDPRTKTSLHCVFFDTSYYELEKAINILAKGNSPIIRFEERIYNENRDFHLSDDDIARIQEMVRLHNALNVPS